MVNNVQRNPEEVPTLMWFGTRLLAGLKLVRQRSELALPQDRTAFVAWSTLAAIAT
jgi:hypothetical protein